MLIKRPRPLPLRILRALYYLVYNTCVKFYRKLVNPHNHGAKVILFHKDTVLLVRIGYAHKLWGFPGGAIEKGEAAKVAAIRELREETGISVPDVDHIGELIWQKEGLVTVQYFVGRTDQVDIYIDDQEIVDAGWFSLDNLPKENLNPAVHKIIALYEESKH